MVQVRIPGIGLELACNGGSWGKERDEFYFHLEKKTALATVAS